ncbi:MAG TPA: hypothetical protein VHS78_10670 [Candidatus Elarobacter sp.]|jgi:hypothetical protein|nr:hypothetical protein [Candidatus Elarobacter sp.]
MDSDAALALERLEALSSEIEDLANVLVVRAKAFGGGERGRVDVVKQRLKIAIDELDGYPYTAEDVTDE